MGIINGTESADRLVGTTGDDQIYGYGGSDRILASEGNDWENGGDGNDTFFLGPGRDTIDGGAGVDTFYLGYALYLQDPYQGAYVVDLAGGSFTGGWLEGDKLLRIENVWGGEQNDTLIGDAQDNLLDGKDGDDQIDGGGGADRIVGQKGSDILRGGAGDDYIQDVYHVVGTTGYIDGGPGNDRLNVVSSADVPVYGGEGDDEITMRKNFSGDSKDDVGVANGGPGNDTLRSSEKSDKLIGGKGDDTFLASTYLYEAFPDVRDVYLGGKGNDTFRSLRGNVTIDGGPGDDTVENLKPGTTAEGGDGIDTLQISGSWQKDFAVDVVKGAVVFYDVTYNPDGSFTQTKTGSASFSGFEYITGVTTHFGSKKDDAFTGDDKVEIVVGRKGEDTVSYEDSDDAVKVNLAKGRGSGGDAEGDTYDSIENLDGSDHDDKLIGDDGDNVIAGRDGADKIDGRGGVDTVDYSESVGRVSVDLEAGKGMLNHAEGDTFANIENITGSDYRDFLTGDDQINVILGRGGDDDIWGGGGADILKGGAGQDRFFSGRGADKMFGGAGVDTVSYEEGKVGVKVDLHAGASKGGWAAGDELHSIENLVGTASKDRLTGDGNDNELSGGGGKDVLLGAGGKDRLLGGRKDDVLDGGKGADALDGGGGKDWASYVNSPKGVSVDLLTGLGTGGHAAGDTLTSIERVAGSDHGDHLYGGVAYNHLYGGDGDDLLYDGPETDLLYGEADADTFVIRYTASGPSQFSNAFVMDFEDGLDRIDLRAFGLAGQQDLDESWTFTGQVTLGIKGADINLVTIRFDGTLNLGPEDFLF